ncbi:hypothetical protein LCGC14_2247290 [marine sediment metagenome]|uniref:Uncharacterized protein n=1 Tax=marine sediment metagenome TaxID=412755 RepID=A0A0F9D3F5_9ZZZZ
MEWPEIVSLVIGISGLVFGGVFAVKWKKAVRLLRKIGWAFSSTAEALDDKKLTKKEAVKLLKDWLDVVEAAFALIGKR